MSPVNGRTKAKAASATGATGTGTSVSNNGVVGGEHRDGDGGGASEGPLCEICERPGHDIFSCDLLREDYGTGSGDAGANSAPLDADGEDENTVSFSSHVRHPTPPPSSKSKTPGEDGPEEELDVWCEECEGHGHRAEECPYAGDVF